MSCLVILASVALVGAYMVVLADMAKRGAGWLALGLFVFPVTFFWVFSAYSGRKRVMIPFYTCRLQFSFLFWSLRI